MYLGLIKLNDGIFEIILKQEGPEGPGALT